jgi:hypothetical protein
MTRRGAASIRAVILALGLLLAPRPALAQSTPAPPLTPAQAALREIY